MLKHSEQQGCRGRWLGGGGGGGGAFEIGVLYLVCTTAVLLTLMLGEQAFAAFDRVMARFMHGDHEEDVKRRHITFKLIPRVTKGSWVIRNAVGSTPVLLGKKLTTKYFRYTIDPCAFLLSIASLALYRKRVSQQNLKAVLWPLIMFHSGGLDEGKCCHPNEPFAMTCAFAAGLL